MYYFCSVNRIKIIHFYSVDEIKDIMNKDILKQVITDNQLEIPNYKIVRRSFSFEEFGNYGSAVKPCV